MPENQIRQAATDYANDLYPRTQAEWEHFAWTKSRPDLFDEAKMHDYNAWTGYDPVNQKHGPWKMHLFSVSEADWRDMCDVIIPYLKEHDIEWKTFNSGYTPEKLTGNQNGKALMKI